MSFARPALPFALAAVLLAGCATVSLDEPPKPRAGSGPAASTAATPGPGETRIVPSQDGSFEGEIIGVAAPGSRFAQLQIGMQMLPVQRLIGIPDAQYAHETGKRWIPFYFGTDSRRMITLYRGEGCLTFTGGRDWGGGGQELIRIEVDPSGRCYQP
ncbi:MAG: hypothetical protein MUF76_01960 [Hydrogenophaga sp.]|jgi:hypothetical protein|nr:hypothetical protein [Hydrogenophaga sp.]